ncbi:hypothetical protein Ancab_008718 [Ancistrocladus abbreviatus]
MPECLMPFPARSLVSRGVFWRLSCYCYQCYAFWSPYHGNLLVHDLLADEIPFIIQLVVLFEGLDAEF